MDSFESVDAVILCGGKGERLQTVVNDRPKSLALVRGRPVLDLLIEKFYDAGVRRFILCTGYLKEQIRNHIMKLQAEDHFPGSRFVFSEEDEPLGTGGALKKAASHIQSENFLVANGDTIWSIDLTSFYSSHLTKSALFTLTLVDSMNRIDCGRVVLDDNNTALSFIERGEAEENSFISVGIYFVNKGIFSHMPESQSFSLEYDLLPQLVSQKMCYGFLAPSPFIDIGTPERYLEAQGEGYV